jgi:hypothetical protein
MNNSNETLKQKKKKQFHNKENINTKNETLQLTNLLSIQSIRAMISIVQMMVQL